MQIALLSDSVLRHYFFLLCLTWFERFYNETKCLRGTDQRNTKGGDQSSMCSVQQIGYFLHGPTFSEIESDQWHVNLRVLERASFGMQYGDA